MKKIASTIIKFIGYFLGWAVLTSILPLSSSGEPAIWRLWAEIMPLLAIIAFTLIFWLIERKNVELHLFDNPVKGMVLGVITGIVWLAVPVLVMYIAKIIHFNGTNSIKLFPVWLLAAFLNVIMQELLVRGYLYQMIKQKHNIVAATIVTTVLFTALHGGAFEAGVVPVLNVLTMSLLMTVVLEYSGSIIAPTIMHFLWNGIGALVLGGVSLADDYPNLLITIFTGNEVLSGGVCKIEGSIIVLFVNMILIFLFMSLKNKQGIK
ncbi:MAG: CPBP family intramembrane metalloprotease [Lachnospiraceae bacterium]|nr:CPBP family intramembrane metalloprotease [Lachnospiraceae bacterium]